MIKLLLLLSLVISLNASKILSYNIYDRTDRVDVMITFDTPYRGVIKQSISNSKITIKLQDAYIESSKTKQISSKYIQSLTITPMSGYTQIVASLPHTVKLQASKTSDAYGLRLRFTNKITPKQHTKTRVSNSLSYLPTKKTDGMEKSYYIVTAILIIGILILFFIKKKVTPKKVQNKQNSWLFKENTAQQENKTEKQISNQKSPQQNTNVSIRFQKSINNENSVVMLDFMDQSYLVLMGKSNILLDKFTDNKPVSQEDFETILQNRHKELDDFIQIQSGEQQTKEPLQSYKERAASIAYDA